MQVVDVFHASATHSCHVFQHWCSDHRLHHDDSRDAACSPSLHSFLREEAVILHTDHQMAVVLQGGPWELGGIWRVGELEHL